MGAKEDTSSTETETETTTTTVVDEGERNAAEQDAAKNEAANGPDLEPANDPGLEADPADRTAPLEQGRADAEANLAAEAARADKASE